MAISPDTEPKSASPRSGAPKGELEQYGVWIKAEPQDIAEDAVLPGSVNMDFEIPGESSVVPEESFLSEDEEKLLGSFDTEFEDIAKSDDEESGPLPDIEDMPPLEESLLSSETGRADGVAVDGISSDDIDISLDDFESGKPSSDIDPGREIDMSSAEDLDSQLSSDSPPSQSDAIEDVSSEFLDMGTETEPPSPKSESSPSSGFGTDLDDVTAEFLDGDNAVQSSTTIESSGDFEPLDIDLHFDDQPGEPSPSSAPSSPDSERISGFDDVAAVERELASPVADRNNGEELSDATGQSTQPGLQPQSVQASQAASAAELSNEILLKIASELSSIRSELVSLKSQIGDVVISSEAVHHKNAEASTEESESEPAPSGGFFDDEEDETIALTGDELDNILNTADFTEEVPEEEELLDLESEAQGANLSVPESLDLRDETLLPESGDYPEPAESEPAIEEVRLGEADSVDKIPVEAAESDVLGLVAEEGVRPMTPTPEDTSYLESPEIPVDSFAAEEEMPLADEPLAEPDLSELDLGPEDMVGRPEIDEELPLASPAESPIEEITLGIEAGPEYGMAEEGVTEAELLEPIAEIEEPNFAEISLHEESLDTPSASDIAEVEEVDALSEADFASLEAETSAESLAPLEEESDLVLSAEEEPPLVAPEAEEVPEAVEELEPKGPEAEAQAPSVEPAKAPENATEGDKLKDEIRSVLSYLDKLLDSLPEEKIEEFARSEYFDTYKKLFEELGLV
jgi:hypothetical protein